MLARLLWQGGLSIMKASTPAECILSMGVIATPCQTPRSLAANAFPQTRAFLLILQTDLLFVFIIEFVLLVSSSQCYSSLRWAK